MRIFKYIHAHTHRSRSKSDKFGYVIIRLPSDSIRPDDDVVGLGLEAQDHKPLTECPSNHFLIIRPTEINFPPDDHHIPHDRWTSIV